MSDTVMPPTFLQAALNGAREHPAVPRTAGEIAADGAAAVAAGATSLHIHVFDDDGAQTFAAAPTAVTVRAVRAACPGIPISLSTSAEIDSDPARRWRAIAEWTVLPDLIIANQGEAGIVDVCRLANRRGIAVEAGLLTLADAEAFVAADASELCVRVLVEPLDEDPDTAVAHAAAIEDVLRTAGIALPQAHHGDGIALWAVLDRAIALGHGIRTGLEDTPVLPDGRTARDNAELVAAAVALVK